MIRFPRIIDISEGACKRVGQFAREMKLGKKAVVFCSERMMEIAGRIVVESLEEKYDVFNTDSIDETELQKIADKPGKYDFAVGIGGGRVMDTAKYSAFLAEKQWIAVPTIPSHDGVVSSRASLKRNGKKISVEASEPCAIVADLNIIREAPYKYIAAGAGDCLSKISAVEDWRIADADGKDRMHAVMANLSLLAADAVAQHAGQIRAAEERGIEVLLWALTCSGFAMNIAGSSRPASGSEHNFSHALDELGSKALHGEQVAIGTIIMQYLQGKDWEKTRETMKTLKLPAKLSDISIDEQTAIKALVNARSVRDRYTILNKIHINERKAEEILESVGVI